MQARYLASLTRPVERPNEVLPATRLLAAFIIPFLVAAAAILLLAPGQTERLFAWPISPTMTAMTLGAAYLAGVVFFARVIFAGEWDAVAVGFAPVVAFASLLGVATLLHWDRFTHDHVAFWTWTALYLTTPFLVLLVWLRNLPAGPPRSAQDDLMSSPVRVVFAVLGLITGVISLGLFLFPEQFADQWPWTLSPLTARVIAATFALPSLLNAGIAIMGRWRATRVAFESQGLALAIILLSYVRASGEMTGNEAARWLFVAGLIALLAGTIAVYAFTYREPRGEGAPATSS
jgi:hypothetical protein